MILENEDLNKLQNYLSIYADAFSGLAQQALNGGLSMGQPNTAKIMPFDVGKLKSLFGDTSKVDMQKLLETQVALMQQHGELWQNASKALMGIHTQATISEAAGDRRFGDSEWNDNPVYSYIKQAYLLNSAMLTNMVESIQFDDDKQAEQARFYTRQYINSVSPTNMALSNPEVCREILKSKGENLMRGVDNFMRDLKQSPKEALKITQCDPHAFALGANLAMTPGKVVFQNELIQLIQYQASTKKVYQAPIILVPPFINKFYIMDLAPGKSLVEWLVEQGHTVFMVSWVNPGAELAEIRFEDYVSKGVVTAVDVVEEISGQPTINAAGYCVGGTVLAVAQAWMRGQGDQRIGSCTFFTTLMDFSEPGELSAYLSEEMLTTLEKHSETKGIFDGRIVALSFNLLRENSLFWSYFVNNYLKGKDPAAFDILYWNSDSTNLPAATFGYYLRKFYLQNELVAGKIEIQGKSVDLAAIDSPSYFLSTVADHIVPWQAAFRSSRYLSGRVKFVLGGSGHVAGVINHPDAQKYSYWSNDRPCPDAQAWQAGAEEVKGSWWPDWEAWLSGQSQSQVTARKLGSETNPAAEDAPGSYVKVRI